MSDETHSVCRWQLEQLKSEMEKLESRIETCQGRCAQTCANTEERMRALEAHDLFHNGYSEAAKEAQKAFFTKLAVLFGGLQAIGALLNVTMLLYLR